VKTFGVCDFSRLAVTDWRLRPWRLFFLALMTATRAFYLLPPFEAHCKQTEARGNNANQSNLTVVDLTLQEEYNSTEKMTLLPQQYISLI